MIRRPINGCNLCGSIVIRMNWKDVPNYYNLYEANTNGSIRNKKTRKMLKPLSQPNGYKAVCLYKNKVGTRMLVHRIILVTFKGRSKLQCNHLDGDKTNNELNNLEYCSASYNLKHAFKLGLKTQRRSKNSFAKLTEKNVLDIRRNLLKLSGEELAIKHSISIYTVRDLRRKQRRQWIGVE